jgi:hypothetical protein
MGGEGVGARFFGALVWFLISPSLFGIRIYYRESETAG